jgi:hypothetical protein
MTNEQISTIVAAVNQAVAESGLDHHEAATVVVGCAVESLVKVRGPAQAAIELYGLALEVARAAGINDDLKSLARH